MATSNDKPQLGNRTSGTFLMVHWEAELEWTPEQIREAFTKAGGVLQCKLKVPEIELKSTSCLLEYVIVFAFTGCDCNRW